MTSSTWTLIAAVLGSGIVFLDSTVVNVALPRIGQELPRSLLGVLEGQSYVYNGYLLTLSSLLILAGALNDFYGRRRMFALGLLAFGVTSILCGLAPSMELLVLFRVLQGAPVRYWCPGHWRSSPRGSPRVRSVAEPSVSGLAPRQPPPSSGPWSAACWWTASRGASCSS